VSRQIFAAVAFVH